MPQAKLPVLDCLRHAIGLAAREPWLVIRAFWPVYVVSAIVHLGRATAWPLAAMLALLPLAAAIPIPCACAWHRHMIHGEDIRQQIGRREWNFLKAGTIIVLLYVAVFLPMLLPVPLIAQSLDSDSAARLLGGAITTIGYLAGTWFAAPMMLALPAAAIGQPLGSSEVAALATPHRLRLTVTILAIPTAAFACRALVDGLDGHASILGFFLEVITYPLEVGVLSLAYLWLTQTKSEVPAP